MGPIDLHKFGYRLVVAPEAVCRTLVQVFIVSPPCTSISGKVVVYKEALKHPSLRTTWLYENTLHPGDNRTEFNCTLFDVGKNKYCFDLYNFSNRSHFPTRVKQCMMIQRNMGLYQHLSSFIKYQHSFQPTWVMINWFDCIVSYCITIFWVSCMRKKEL